MSCLLDMLLPLCALRVTLLRQRGAACKDKAYKALCRCRYAAKITPLTLRYATQMRLLLLPCRYATALYADKMIRRAAPCQLRAMALCHADVSRIVALRAHSAFCRWMFSRRLMQLPCYAAAIRRRYAADAC